MVHNCAVFGCTGAGYRMSGGQKVTFHEFPSNEKLRKIWLIKIRRDVGELFSINKGITKICSLHFNESDFRTFAHGRRLKSTAVPSKFLWSKTEKTRVNPLDKINRDQSQSTEEDKGLVQYNQDHTYNAQEIDYKSNLETVTNENKILNNRIKILEQTISEQGLNPYSYNSLIKSPKADSKINFYTGFPSVSVLNLVYDLMNPGPNGENIIQYNSTSSGITYISQAYPLLNLGLSLV